MKTKYHERGNTKTKAGKPEIAKNNDVITPLELSEKELRCYKDNLYQEALSGNRNFHSLLEVILCRENIIDAIRKVKSNDGFNTKGTDGIKGNDVLQQDAEQFFEQIKELMCDYKPQKVKRVYIPKRNGKYRPLGIPSVIDKIIQTAIANIIEPIAEGTFYEHSYGFRPMREIEHVYGYLSALINTNTERHWVVEGDIKGFFDNVDHNILMDKLFKYGIRDKRVLMIIKKILKAGISDGKNSTETNAIGTPQGGTLSPLLANIYLTDFDHWVNKQWNGFSTEKQYANQSKKVRALKQTNLKDGYLIRYADDWIIVTTSEEKAEKWKYTCQKFLKDKLKLEMSEEKTLITDMSKKSMDFLGITSWVEKGSKGKLTLRTMPQKDRLKEKVSELYVGLRKIRTSSNDAELIENITNYNSVVRGINNYYRITTLYNAILNKEEWKMRGALQRTLHTTKLKRVEMSKCQNLSKAECENSKSHTLAYCYEKVSIGLEKPGMGKFKRPRIKAQWITPFTQEGRDKYEEITQHRWGTLPRNPWLTLGNISDLIAKNPNSIYNLEYFINRPMAFNRDKGKCRTCKKCLDSAEEVNIHHKDKDLPIDKVNKVSNLITLCINCHYQEHDKQSRKSKEKAIKNTNPNSRRSAIKPSKDQLLKEIQTTPFTQLSKKYGVSDNAIRKWAKSYGIYEQRKIKLKTNKNNSDI